MSTTTTTVRDKHKCQPALVMILFMLQEYFNCGSSWPGTRAARTTRIDLNNTNVAASCLLASPQTRHVARVALLCECDSARHVALLRCYIEVSHQRLLYSVILSFTIHSILRLLLLARPLAPRTKHSEGNTERIRKRRSQEKRERHI
jgi:hypothetical protein